MGILDVSFNVPADQSHQTEGRHDAVRARGTFFSDELMRQCIRFGVLRNWLVGDGEIKAVKE